MERRKRYDEGHAGEGCVHYHKAMFSFLSQLEQTYCRTQIFVLFIRFSSAGDDSPRKDEGAGNADLPEWEWDDTIKGDPREAAAKEEAARKEREARDARERAAREASKRDSKAKPSSSKDDKKHKNSKDGGSTGRSHSSKKPEGQRPSALTSVIYPAMRCVFYALPSQALAILTSIFLCCP